MSNIDPSEDELDSCDDTTIQHLLADESAAGHVTDFSNHTTHSTMMMVPRNGKVGGLKFSKDAKLNVCTGETQLATDLGETKKSHSIRLKNAHVSTFDD